MTTFSVARIESFLKGIGGNPRFAGDIWLLLEARAKIAGIAWPVLPDDPYKVVEFYRSVLDSATLPGFVPSLAKLTRINRDALILADMLGVSYAVASRILNVPVGTVKSRLSRARTYINPVRPIGPSGRRYTLPQSVA